MALVKKIVVSWSPKSPEETFAELLTPYAFNYVEKQLLLRKNVTAASDPLHSETGLYHLQLARSLPQSRVASVHFGEACTCLADTYLQ